jgi:chromosomal replication initiation ATPase DnaA
VLTELKLQMTKATFDTWLRGSELQWHGGRAFLVLRNAYAVEWVEHRMMPVIRRTLDVMAGREIPLHPVTADDLEQIVAYLAQTAVAETPPPPD